jgi:hypothetical protein
MEDPMRARDLRLATFVLAFSVATCGESPVDPYEPDLPTSWATSVTNPFFPLEPGTMWEYTSETDEGTETIVVEVLSETRVVNGVTAAVVHDQVVLEGDLVENTYDWYAQDAEGNVWYLGEDTEELENGVVVSTDGSWEWNVDGALPGIYMWADPSAHVGDEYRQEYYEGEAEDWGKIMRVNEPATVPFGTFQGCVVTEDWNALEGRSETLENKYYCPGVGTVLEHSASDATARVELIDRAP